LEHARPETDWPKLASFLHQHTFLGKKVSVSGGGDSLYRFEQHRKWWERFLYLAHYYNMKVDVHTREKFRKAEFWFGINKCVFSSDKLENDIGFLNWVSRYTKLRITHLVTANTTFRMIDVFVAFQKKTNCEFTIKQMIGYSDKGAYNRIKAKYPKIFRLPAGDYNIYYMPDNSIRAKFLETQS
jgi:hypothetical protein